MYANGAKLQTLHSQLDEVYAVQATSVPKSVADAYMDIRI